jgi:protein SCO1/2
VTLRARWRAAAAVAALAGAVATLSLLSMAGGGASAPSVAAPPARTHGLPALGFAPPAAGSYRLERILQAPDGAVLDSDGSAHRLRDFTTGRITLFSFIYTYCTDPQGCPLAFATLHALKDMIVADPALRGKVRFVSMSFDPVFDTPAMMRSYGDADALPGNALPWHFLTTASNAQLAPLLAGFGQDVTVITAGQPAQRAPVLAHLLKVYLIDQDGMVREIYSPAYLHPRILRNDIVTLLLEVRAGQP